ncbi:hypothetical protein NDU88_005179 [Pleurodeles waltl]|uniref:Uncharacterized protein n=1 Tax=Pleurodeles waltl TaxID=8319 RepID=A0AAV7WXT0_PLEWA|nr:hypothetical protein NDU88_005179 [Pleurodeles waltl]
MGIRLQSGPPRKQLPPLRAGSGLAQPSDDTGFAQEATQSSGECVANLGGDPSGDAGLFLLSTHCPALQEAWNKGSAWNKESLARAASLF